MSPSKRTNRDSDTTKNIMKNKQITIKQELKKELERRQQKHMSCSLHDIAPSTDPRSNIPDLPHNPTLQTKTEFE